MDRYQEFVVFDAVVAEGGLAGAARRLDVSAPTITRAVAALEARYRVQAFERSTRGVVLTAAGRALHERVRHLLDELEVAENTSAGMHRRAEGHLVVAAPSRLGRQLLLPIMLAHLQANPGTTIDARFLDRPVNLHEEGIDVALHAGTLADSSNFAVPVGAIRRVVVASPGYLAAHGTPTAPGQIVEHALIQSLADAPTPNWTFHVDGEPRHVSLSPRLVVSNNDAAIDCALDDFGLTRVMSYQVAPHFAAGTLRALLVDHAGRAIPLHLLYREGRRAARKVRAFVDAASTALRGATGVGITEQ